jgi:dTDP-4-dehydrorhamnose 3,5-epimerase
MKFSELEIPGVFLIEPKIFEDERGFFYESYREQMFARYGIQTHFIQENMSFSKKGILRGLHFQAEPKAQAKLVTVLQGEVFDVAVDLRKGSKTFGKHVSALLSGKNRKLFFVPPGFAHGFLALEETKFLYKVDQYYAPASERGILWNDPVLGIPWPKLDCDYILAERDQRYPTFQENFPEGAQ